MGLIVKGKPEFEHIHLHMIRTALWVGPNAMSAIPTLTLQTSSVMEIFFKCEGLNLKFFTYTLFLNYSIHHYQTMHISQMNSVTVDFTRFQEHYTRN